MNVLDLSLATPPAPIGRCGHTDRRRRLDGGVRGHGIYLPLPTCAAHRHYVAGLGDEPALGSPLSEQIRFLGNRLSRRCRRYESELYGFDENIGGRIDLCRSAVH